MDHVNRFESTFVRLKKIIEGIQLDRKDGSQVKHGNLELGEMAYRVIHLNNNPYSQHLCAKTAKRKTLKDENERLKARLALLEAGNSADVTRKIDDAVNSGSQIELLTREVNELKTREEKILNSFKKTSREFREVCYMLTGYKIDPLRDEVFRLSHMYAEHEEDRLYFEVERDGTISLLRNAYTDQYSQYMSTYLEEADSFPAFLAAITLDLFKSSTQVDMSMTISTTMIANNTVRR